MNNTESLVTRATAMAAGAGTGTWIGAGIGIVGGPVSGIADTVPGALFGGVTGWLLADQFRRCPQLRQDLQDLAGEQLSPIPSVVLLAVPSMRTLCIDVGGTRIKSVILPQRPDLAAAHNARPFAVRTHGWLNHSLPKLVDPEHWASVAAYYRRQGENYERIAMDLPAGISPSGEVFGRDDLVHSDARLPQQLRSALEAASGRPVTLLNDAEAWMFGIASYADLTGLSLAWPVLALIFGTGLGVAAGRDPRTLMTLDPMELSWACTECEKVAGIPLDQAWKAHQVVGREFFEWIEREQRGWTHEEIRQQFTRRVAAVIEGLSTLTRSRLGQVRTIVVGGGNTEFVPVRMLTKATGIKVVALSEGSSKLPPDLTPLLGLEAAANWRG